MESTDYMESIASARSLRLSEEQQLEGTTTISLETCEDLQEEDILTYIQENFADFLRAIRFLKKEDQELLLSYYLLSKTQNTLATIHKSTQTVCSFKIRMAVKTLGTYIMLGEPTVPIMHDILEKAGLENGLQKVTLSQVIDEYSKCRSFQRIAWLHQLHRPDIRRYMSKASKQLMESTESREHALGAYIYNLIDKCNPTGPGYSSRKLAKQGHIYIKCPDICGQFRMKIDDPDFASIFVSKANR